MDELPRSARAFLDLTRDAHDPPDALARERVQARLAAALAPIAVDAAATEAQRVAHAMSPGGGWIAAHKMLVTVVVVVATGGAWLANQARHAQPSASGRPAAVEVGAVETQAEELRGGAPHEAAPSPVESALPTRSAVARPSLSAPEAASGVRARPRAPASLAAARSLTEEMRLLERASDQLGQHRLAPALEALAQHRRRFGQSAQLREERDGLLALAQCLGARPQAKHEAQRYLARAPGSVFATRLEQACGL